MKAWFASLAPRERAFVVAAGVALAAAALYLFVWEPLFTAETQLRERVEREAVLAAWVSDLGSEAARLRQRAGETSIKGRDDSLLSIVDATARAAGLGEAIQRIQPEGDDQASVTLEAAAFNKLLFWLRTLERDYGVAVAALTVSRAEQTGAIQARMTLRRDTG